MRNCFFNRSSNNKKNNAALSGNAIRYSVKAIGDLSPDLREEASSDDEDANDLTASIDTTAPTEQSDAESGDKSDKVYLPSGIPPFVRFPYDNWTSTAWTVDGYDIEALAVGVGALGCGGGGSPYLAKLTAKESLQRGKKMVIRKHAR